MKNLGSNKKNKSCNEVEGKKNLARERKGKPHLFGSLTILYWNDPAKRKGHLRKNDSQFFKSHKWLITAKRECNDLGRNLCIYEYNCQLDRPGKTQRPKVQMEKFSAIVCLT